MEYSPSNQETLDTLMMVILQIPFQIFRETSLSALIQIKGKELDLPYKNFRASLIRLEEAMLDSEKETEKTRDEIVTGVYNYQLSADLEHLKDRKFIGKPWNRTYLTFTDKFWARGEKTIERFESRGGDLRKVSNLIMETVYLPTPKGELMRRNKPPKQLLSEAYTEYLKQYMVA